MNKPTTATFLTRTEAENLVKTLTADEAKITAETNEPGWTYKAEHPADGKGWSRVLAFDETGAEMGYL